MPQKSILIADDEEGYALTLGTLLRAQGYHVRVAGNGQETLEQVETERPDLILLDAKMPVMDGYTCLRTLNDRYGHCVIPIIILTGLEEMKDVFQLQGIEDFLVKPCDHHELLTRIDSILTRRNGTPPAS